MKLKYVDTRPIYLPALVHYPGGVALPSGSNEINVTDGEAKNLLKIKNGEKNVFQEIKKKVIPEIEEADNGSR